MLAQLNKKALIFLSAGGVFALLLIVSIYLHFAAPAIIEKKILQGLEQQFGYAKAAQLERKSGAVILTGISLDADDFNSIASIQARYRFFSLMIFGQIEKIILKSPSLTYSMNSDNLLQPPKDLLSRFNISSAPLFKANLIEISDGSLDVLTTDWGGFHFDFDAQIRALDHKTRALTANLNSNQKKFSTQIQIDGEINKETGWSIESSIERSRLELEDIQISRAAGRMGFSGSDSGFFANGEFNIGGFKIGEFAWSDIAATFEQSENNFQWVIAGNALGNKDIEFGLNYNQKDPLNIYGTLYTKKLSDFLLYLNNDQVENLETSPIAQIEDVFLTYSLPKSTIFNNKKNIIFSFKKPEQGIDIKGNLYIDSDHFLIRALMSPTFVQNINSGYEGIALNKALMNASLNYSSLDNEAAENVFVMNMRDGVVSFGPLKLSAIQTSLSFSPPEKMQMNDLAEISFKLPLKDSLEQNGRANFQLGETLSIRDLTYNVFGSVIKLNKIDISALPETFNINTSNLSLKDIAQAINQSMDASGTMNLKGQLHVQNDKISAQNMVLKSNGSGTLSIPEEYTKAVFTDKSIDHEMAIEALQNFNYDYFEITINGDLQNEATIKLEIKGRNSELLNNRPILINMTLANQKLSGLWQSLSDKTEQN